MWARLSEKWLAGFVELRKADCIPWVLPEKTETGSQILSLLTRLQGSEYLLVE
jgi:hypothetical protein